MARRNAVDASSFMRNLIRILPAALSASLMLGGFDLCPLTAQLSTDSVRAVPSRLPGSGPDSGVGQNYIPILAPWVGAWESQSDTTSDGREFRFHFDLEWADPGNSLISFEIRQAFRDGETHLLWEGTKGFDPIRNVTFSDQISPSGIVGRGVYSAGLDGTLVVQSRGFSPRGPGPAIRDVFEPLAGERAFRTTTHLFRSGEWQKNRVDVWRPRSVRQPPPDSMRAAAGMSRLVGAWSVQPVGRDEPTGRLDVSWLENEHTLRKRMTLLQGEGAGVAAEGIVGWDPSSSTLRGLDFQSMIWPEARLVHVMFESEYVVADTQIQRLYTVSYPPNEPLMPLKEQGGNQREFRETYTFVDENFIRWTTEVLDAGEWKPFGGAGAGSELRRIGGS